MDKEHARASDESLSRLSRRQLARINLLFDLCCFESPLARRAVFASQFTACRGGVLHDLEINVTGSSFITRNRIPGFLRRLVRLARRDPEF